MTTPTDLIARLEAASGAEDALYFDPIVTRRPEPERQTFDCACCQRTITIDPWRPKWNEPPICGYCTGTFGSGMSIRAGITRADVRLLQRLSALSSRIEWEVKNGNS